MSTTFAQDIPRWKATEIEKYLQQNSDKVLVINMWATFCKPCVAEIPAFIQLAEQYKNNGVKLLLVSVDLPSHYPKKIAAFAKKNKFNAPMVWLDETNADYFCPLFDPKWSGSIPATLIVYPKTGYRKFFEEEIEADQLEKEIIAALKSNS
jgi:thiol-disulfide isomerase/thioredoxin